MLKSQILQYYSSFYSSLNCKTQLLSVILKVTSIISIWNDNRNWLEWI